MRITRHSDTLLTWHRNLITQKYDGHDKRQPGRPRIREELESLVVRMAEENRRWVIAAFRVHWARWEENGVLERIEFRVVIRGNP